MQIHQLNVADALASLKSGSSGLSDAEAQRRRVEFGPNEVEVCSQGDACATA